MPRRKTEHRYCVIRRQTTYGNRKMLSTQQDAEEHAASIFRTYDDVENAELLVVEVKKVIRRPIDLEYCEPAVLPASK